MSKVLVVYEEGMPEEYFTLIDIVRDYYEENGFTAEIFCIEDGMTYDQYKEVYNNISWEYICTFDMAGFQINTILGDPRYNIMPAKQIHIVINEEIFTLYQNMEFALNLYLFMPETMRDGYIQHMYIPNLSFYSPFALKEGSIGDKEELIGILDKVRKECELLCG